jgi:hypothetical protein
MTLATAPLTTTNTIAAFARESEDALDDHDQREISNLASAAIGIESNRDFKEKIGISKEDFRDLVKDSKLRDQIKEQIKDSDLIEDSKLRDQLNQADDISLSLFSGIRELLCAISRFLGDNICNLPKPPPTVTPPDVSPPKLTDIRAFDGFGQPVENALGRPVDPAEPTTDRNPTQYTRSDIISIDFSYVDDNSVKTIWCKTVSFFLWQDCTSPQSPIVVGGENNFHVYAEDDEGNESPVFTFQWIRI